MAATQRFSFALSLCTFKRKTSPHSLVIDNNARLRHSVSWYFAASFLSAFYWVDSTWGVFFVVLIGQSNGARSALASPPGQQTHTIHNVHFRRVRRVPLKKSQLYLVSRSSGAELVLWLSHCTSFTRLVTKAVKSVCICTCSGVKYIRFLPIFQLCASFTGTRGAYQDVRLNVVFGITRFPRKQPISLNIKKYCNVESFWACCLTERFRKFQRERGSY